MKLAYNFKTRMLAVLELKKKKKFVFDVMHFHCITKNWFHI